MSGVKHTPGCWYPELDSADQLRHIWSHIDDEPILVAVVMGDLSDDVSEEPQANACLIAAAPDLLAVAIKSHEPYEGLSEDDIRSLYGPEEAELAMSLRAAIARARGEQDGGGS